MLFVNHAGKDPAWIAHAPWDGIHLADLVMPCFLFLVGMSAALSLTAQRQRGMTKDLLMRRVLSRTGKLTDYSSLAAAYQHNLSFFGRSHASYYKPHCWRSRAVQYIAEFLHKLP